MQPEKSMNLKKIFPNAYITVNELTIKITKKNSLFILTFFGLTAILVGLFLYFQTNLINEAEQLSEIIR